MHPFLKILTSSTARPPGHRTAPRKSPSDLSNQGKDKGGGAEPVPWTWGLHEANKNTSWHSKQHLTGLHLISSSPSQQFCCWQCQENPALHQPSYSSTVLERRAQHNISHLQLPAVTGQGTATSASQNRESLFLRNFSKLFLWNN